MTQTLTATSENKDATYFALVHLHTLALSDSRWLSGDCYTNNADKHFITEMNIGGASIKAESINGSHTYTFKQELNNE